MSDVRLTIAGRHYTVTCRDGEERQLVRLGQLVDAKAREAAGAAQGLSEARTLLFAALLLADELAEHGATPGANGASPVPAEDDGPSVEGAIADAEALQARLASLLSSLEELADTP